MKSMNRRTVLVCGGAGFIGSNFVRLLLARPVDEVIVLDKLTYAGNRRNLPADERLHFVHGDIGDSSLVTELLRAKRPQWVVNFAAETHVDRSIDGPAPFLHTNVVGTFVLLEAIRLWLAQAGNISSFRFLQVSSDEVFGSLPEAQRASESAPYAPRSPYAASKAAADHFVHAYGVTYGLPVLLTNCSNNFGPYQFPEKLMPLVILNALDGRPLPVYGDGLYVRDWLFVEDHCEALLFVLEKAELGARYNIGAGNELTNLEVVERICDALERTIPAAKNPALERAGVREYRQLIRFVEDRPGHDRRYALDFSKIQRELGWQPRHDFPSALQRTVEWYCANRPWCEAVLSDRYDRRRLGLLRASAE
jgi:dTDP-glucose 4,6-dehydratase